MPATRKVSGGRQATLSFNHRVTKPSVQRQSAKEAALLTEKVEKEKKKDEEIEEKEKKTEVEDKKVTIEAEKDEAESEVEEEDDKSTEVKAPAVAARPEAEIKADAITDAQVRRYWRGIEAQAISRRVHQEDLDLGEKVLRHFDVSSQYGPCVGITRKTRWLRAQRLGLAPPIEVLAVMLKEEAKGVQGIQRSSFDDILNASVTA
ncbi:hypothetical protein SEUCBS139899_010451 [Sporothrix eucalyptigena]|uniref:DNA polymerase delta subunit 4 n=1 Tax=Sporothrix eucalyptigena TaxID=1812306 RepID=A0ABP0CR15_9PEZI